MLVIGAIFVDVKGFARSQYMPLERNVGDVQVTAGGVCRNVAENLSRLGVPAKFVSMVDDDAMGSQVRDELAALVRLKPVAQPILDMFTKYSYTDCESDAQGRLLLPDRKSVV